MIDDLMIGMLGYEERLLVVMSWTTEEIWMLRRHVCVSFVITWYNAPRLFDYSGLKPFHPAAAYWTRCSI